MWRYDEGTEGAGSKSPVMPELPNPPLLAFTDGFWLSIYQNKTTKIKQFLFVFSMVKVESAHMLSLLS